MTVKKAAESNAPEFDVPEGTALPFLGVARALAATEVARLWRKVATLEEQSVGNVGIGPTGIVDPYLRERNEQFRVEAEEIKAEIAALESMDDRAARVWAYRRGYR